MKTTIPVGDGQWAEVEADQVTRDQQADLARQEQARQDAFIEEAGTLTERLMKYDTFHCTEHRLTKEHRAFAAALYCINLRETYPGGPEEFDQLAEDALKYWQANTK